MKYIFDLDDTLIYSTALNNDAYNYALEKFGYPRINTSKRLTREKLKFISSEKLKKIIEEKQKYFTGEWLSYRVILNSELIERIKKYGILGISFFVGLTISDKYFEGNRIIGYSICFSLVTVAIIFIDLTIFLIVKKLQSKAINNSNDSLSKNEYHFNKIQKFILIFLLVLIIIFVVLIMLGLCGIIQLSAICLLVLAICSFVLSCVGFIVAFRNKK